jgi:hypothetical protein
MLRLRKHIVTSRNTGEAVKLPTLSNCAVRACDIALFASAAYEEAVRRSVKPAAVLTNTTAGTPWRPVSDICQASFDRIEGTVVGTATLEQPPSISTD